MNRDWMQNHKWLASVAVAGWVGATVAQAVPPDFKVDFGTDTPGSPPITGAAVAGGLTIHPQFVGTGLGVSPSNSVLVANTYTDTQTGLVFGNGNVAVMSDLANNDYNYLRFVGAPSDAVSGGIVTVRWDMLIDKGHGLTGNFLVGLYDYPWSALVGALMFNVASSVQLIDSNGNQFNSVPITWGTNMHWDVTLNYGTGAQEVFLNGVSEGSGVLNTSIPFDRVHFAGGNAMEGVVALDNFQIVPEPCSAALLGASGLISLLRLRRKQE